MIPITIPIANTSTNTNTSTNIHTSTKNNTNTTTKRLLRVTCSGRITATRPNLLKVIKSGQSGLESEPELGKVVGSEEAKSKASADWHFRCVFFYEYRDSVHYHFHHFYF